MRVVLLIRWSFEFLVMWKSKIYRRARKFCVRMAQEIVRIPAGEFMMGSLDGDRYAPDWEKTAS